MKKKKKRRKKEQSRGSDRGVRAEGGRVRLPGCGARTGADVGISASSPPGAATALDRGFQIFRHIRLSKWPLDQAATQNLDVVTKCERT